MTPDQERKLNETHEKLCRIELALLGDDMGSIGLAQRLIKNEEQIKAINARVDLYKNEYDAKENKRKGIMIAVAAIWSAIMLLINKIT